MNNQPVICVCGAGTMGSGIAQVFAQRGFPVILYDISREMLHRAQSLTTSMLQQLVTKGKLTPEEKASALSNIRFTDQLNECRANLIIEAIAENASIKVELLKKLIETNAGDTIFTTNTSSLSVRALAASLPDAKRFAGMHFFNPAPVMKLVEVIDTGLCDDSTIQFILSIVKEIGKTPVRCKDAPGFIVNRVARPYYLEALRLAEMGISFDTIDGLMESSGFKMGPFRLMDLIGNDINFSVSNIVYEALGKPPRLQPSPIQKKKVEDGHLGRKTGKGYYEYAV